MKIPFQNTVKKNINIIILLTIALFPIWHGWPIEVLAQQSTVSPPSGSGDILLSGKLTCSLKRAVIMPFFGIITSLPVQAGQRVAKGDLLAKYKLSPESVIKIRSRIFPTEIKNLEMTRIKLAAKLTELEKQQSGLQQLAANNMASQQSLDQVENEIHNTCKEQNATAERLSWARQLHQDDLALLQKQLGRSDIKNIPSEGRLTSPVDGYVVWINSDIRLSAEFKPEQPAFLIGDLDTMIIKAQVHELEAMRLRLGDQAEVQSSSLPGKKFTAQVTRVSWSSITNAPDQPSFFEVEFSVPNPDHLLKDGLKVQLTVPKASTS